MEAEVVFLSLPGPPGPPRPLSMGEAAINTTHKDRMVINFILSEGKVPMRVV